LTRANPNNQVAVYARRSLDSDVTDIFIADVTTGETVAQLVSSGGFMDW